MVQAGCYGRAFCPVATYPRKKILQVCQSLRILNALRGPNVGVPLTLPQLEALTPAVLVSRLINARRHLLALRVAEMLDMDTAQVHMHMGDQTRLALAVNMPAMPRAGCHSIP